MSPGVTQVRIDICTDCPTRCASVPDPTDPCAACPLQKPRWGAWSDCASSDTPVKMRGLGDLVAKIAEPVARAIKLDKSKCGCAKRREWLNRMVSFSDLQKRN